MEIVISIIYLTHD